MQLMPEKYSNLFSALTVAWLVTLLLSCSYQHSQCKQSSYLDRCLLSKTSVGRRGKWGRESMREQGKEGWEIWEGERRDNKKDDQ